MASPRNISKLQMRAEEAGIRQKFVSDVFHSLSQPLTALCCSVELALHKPGSVEEYREALENALVDTKRTIQLATFIRELAESDDPGEFRTPISLTAAVREMVEEFLPVAESQQIQLRANYEGNLKIYADPARIRLGIFYLIDTLLHDSPANSCVTVELKEVVNVAVLTICNKDCTRELREREPVQSETENRALKLAGRIFAAVDGGLRINQSGVVVCIPLEQSDLPQ